MAFNRPFNLKSALVFMIVLTASIVVARAELGPDSWITIRAKSALDVDEGVRAGTISVDTLNGCVTLHGKVPSARDKARAAEDVGQVLGVLRVRNILQVVEPAGREGVRRSDAALKVDVQKSLRGDRSLGNSRIIVKSVSNGVVLLGGSTASSSDNVRALRVTANRPGVRRVFSEIEAQKTFDATTGAKNVGVQLDVVSILQRRPVLADDETIRRAVKSALNALDDPENQNIHVGVNDGVVRLSGAVPTWPGNSPRIETARSVTGVRSVVNAMRVVPLDSDQR